MKRSCLPAAIATALLVGCSPAEKPPAKQVDKPAQIQSACRLFDDFNLPLVIQIDAPEPPLEIRNPSTPIKEQRHSP